MHSQQELLIRRVATSMLVLLFSNGAASCKFLHSFQREATQEKRAAISARIRALRRAIAITGPTERSAGDFKVVTQDVDQSSAEWAVPRRRILTQPQQRTHPLSAATCSYLVYHRVIH
jgi:hypothetical protein